MHSVLERMQNISLIAFNLGTTAVIRFEGTLLSLQGFVKFYFYFRLSLSLFLAIFSILKKEDSYSAKLLPY